MANVVVEATGARIVAGQSGVAATAPVDSKGPFGYLSEGSRQNLVLYSEDLSNWAAPTEATVSTNAAVAPDGATTMDKLIPSVNNLAHFIDRTFAGTNGTVYTRTIYAKTSGYLVLQLCASGGELAGNPRANFDLANGVLGSVDAAFTASIENVGNGVYRCRVTFTSAFTGTNYLRHTVVNSTTAAHGAAFAGDGTSGILLWGCDCEAASIPSTYIPTTSAAVTRAADADGYATSGNVPANDFTLCGETVFSRVPTAASYFMWASYVDASNYTAVLWDGTNLIARKRLAGVNKDATIALTPTANTAFKWAATFSSTAGIQVYLNGTAGTADATTTAPQLGTTFQINADGNGANQPFATSRKVHVVPRVLTAAQIAAAQT